MIYLAISRFKVANNMQGLVAQALIDRPKLVEDVPGFIDMEVYNPEGDSSEFWLLTRWKSKASFENWHHSDAYRKSHQAIPKGLKLDPKQTFVRQFTRLTD